MRDLPSGTVTLLFTDIEGSTRLLHDLGPDGYAEALAEHRRIVRKAFIAHGGVEVDTQGDAFFVAFPDGAEAITAALEAQEVLTESPIRVRMGLHTGEPTLTEEGYVGVDVHAGARIAAAAHGGQVVLSRRTKDHAGGSFQITDLGEHRLKDLPEPMWIYQLGDASFPPLKTLSNTNLPTPASSFLGRERELTEAAALLGRNRIVTILGPGGAGKTRFSIELASRHLDRFPNGVFWVPLATVRDPALVLETVARVLGANEGLAEHIGDRTMMLLLDNLEQVIDASPALADLPEACPNLTILVTSRERMRVRGEQAYALPPLETDQGVALFVERAGVILSDAVTALCRRLEGLPLAIELAAARASVLTPEQLLARLGERLDILRGGRDADPRQRTLRATIEWSHDLLSPEEKRSFDRLGVFVGGWTLESGAEVAGAGLDAVQSLVDKSLVRRTEDRFWMLETIREFAIDRLEASGEAEDVKRRHATFMLELARSANLSVDSTAPQRQEIVLPEQDNMRGALEWAVVCDDADLGLQLASSLSNFWVSQNPWEGIRWFERLFARDAAVDEDLRARALRDYGGCCDIAGEMERAAELYGRSLELFRSLGDELNAGDLIHRFAVVALVDRDLPRAREFAEQTLEIGRRVGSIWLEAQAFGSLAHVVRSEGDLRRAAEMFERSAALAFEAGNAWYAMNGIANLGELALDEGRYDEVVPLARQILEYGERTRDRSTELYGFIYLARVAIARGDSARAGWLWGAVEAEQSRLPVRRGWENDRDLLTRGFLPFDDPDFEQGRIEGRGLSIEEAAERALEV